MQTDNLSVAAAPAHKPAAGSALQFLRFSVGAEAYVVRIEGVREILEVTQITPVPLMPGFMRGVMNLRGVVVPVVDLSVRLGFDATEVGKRTCVVVVTLRAADGRQQTLGMLVDAVHEVFKGREDDLEPVPRLGTSISPGFIRAMVRVRGEITVELALDELVGQQTLAQLIGAGMAH
jgi:purine-binding chemotaxis protein CheW